MKILCITCKEGNEKKNRALLQSHGLSVYKIIQIMELDRQTNSLNKTGWIRILFTIMDEETEMLLKLKYPSGTFEENPL